MLNDRQETAVVCFACHTSLVVDDVLFLTRVSLETVDSQSIEILPLLGRDEEARHGASPQIAAGATCRTPSAIPFAVSSFRQ
jgi:hypothetical protein